LVAHLISFDTSFSPHDYIMIFLFEIIVYINGFMKTIVMNEMLLSYVRMILNWKNCMLF